MVLLELVPNLALALLPLGWDSAVRILYYARAVRAHALAAMAHIDRASADADESDAVSTMRVSHHLRVRAECIAFRDACLETARAALTPFGKAFSEAVHEHRSGAALETALALRYAGRALRHVWATPGDAGGEVQRATTNVWAPATTMGQRMGRGAVPQGTKRGGIGGTAVVVPVATTLDGSHREQRTTARDGRFRAPAAAASRPSSATSHGSARSLRSAHSAQSLRSAASARSHASRATRANRASRASRTSPASYGAAATIGVVTEESQSAAAPGGARDAESSGDDSDAASIPRSARSGVSGVVDANGDAGSDVGGGDGGGGGATKVDMGASPVSSPRGILRRQTTASYFDSPSLKRLAKDAVEDMLARIVTREMHLLHGRVGRDMDSVRFAARVISSPEVTLMIVAASGRTNPLITGIAKFDLVVFMCAVAAVSFATYSFGGADPTSAQASAGAVAGVEDAADELSPAVMRLLVLDGTWWVAALIGVCTHVVCGLVTLWCVRHIAWYHVEGVSPARRGLRAYGTFLLLVTAASAALFGVAQLFDSEKESSSTAA